MQIQVPVNKHPLYQLDRINRSILHGQPKSHRQDAYVLLQIEKSNNDKGSPGNEIEQSAVERTDGEEHIRLADIQNVREHITQYNIHLTRRIDRYEILGHAQNTTVYGPSIVANCEARGRRQQNGRSYFHYPRCNPHQELTPDQNEAKVCSKQDMGTRY